MNRSAFFELSERTRNGILSGLGWRSLRPVQELSIPPLVRGDDAVVLAPTAGGKTEAALLPLLDRLTRTPQGTAAPNVLYLCPLKALINNLLPRLQSLAGLVGYDAFAWHGEVSQSARKSFLKEPKAVLLTTPESLQVLLSRRGLDQKELWGGLQTVVIDEVHAFCGDPRGDQLIALLSQLDGWSGRAVQRVGLSATVGNPEHLLDWLSGQRGRPSTLVDPERGGAPKKKRLLEIHPVGDDPDERADLLTKLMARSPKSLLFVDSRRQAEEMRHLLAGRGLEAHAHHSSLSREQRELSEDVFRKSGASARRPQVIVCTSTLELGLDVGDVDRVFLLDAPTTVSAFLQRFGRAGRRAESVGHMLFVTDGEESFLRACALVKLALDKKVEPVLPSRRAYPVLVQQMLMLILREGALAPDRLLNELGRPSCFADIDHFEREAVLAHLLAEGWLYRSEGRLHLGQRVEKAYGRSHFLELLSVFTGGVSASVLSADGRSLGTVDYAVARQLAESRAAFLLGGSSWKAQRWDENARTLTVVKSSGGRSVRWSGLGSELEKPVVRACRELLTSSDPISFLGPRANEQLENLRRTYLHLDPELPVAWETKSSTGSPKSGLELWAGHGIGRTVGGALAGYLGCSYSSDVRAVRFPTPARAWMELMASAPREPEQLQGWLEAGLRLREQAEPTEDGSEKFCELLPPEAAREVRWRNLYRLEGAVLLWPELLQTALRSPGKEAR